MAITKKFLVDTSNFEEIAEALRTSESLPNLIDAEFLELLGYSNPPDFLVLSLFKELNLLNQDDTPTELLKKFRNPETSKEAISFGIASAYKDLLEIEPSIYKKDEDDIKESLRSLFEEDKSDLILQYMANTFKVITDYAGHDTLDKMIEHENSDVSSIETIVKQIAGKYQKDQAIETHNGIDTEQHVAVEGKVDPPSPIAEPDKNLNHENNGKAEIPEIEKSSTAEAFEDGNKKNAGVNEKPKNTLPPLEQPQYNQPFEDVDIEQTKAKKPSSEKEYINQAYIKKAELLYKLNRYEEAFPALDMVHQKFAKSSNNEFYNHASVALIRKMDIAEKLGYADELIPIYNSVINRLDTAEENEFTEYVHHAYLNRAESLLKTDNGNEAIEAINQTIDRFKSAPGKQDFVIQLMYKKAELYEQKGFDQKALNAYEELLHTFG